MVSILPRYGLRSFLKLLRIIPVPRPPVDIEFLIERDAYGCANGRLMLAVLLTATQLASTATR